MTVLSGRGREGKIEREGGDIKARRGEDEDTEREDGQIGSGGWKRRVEIRKEMGDNPEKLGVVVL